MTQGAVGAPVGQQRLALCVDLQREEVDVRILEKLTPARWRGESDGGRQGSKKDGEPHRRRIGGLGAVPSLR